MKVFETTMRKNPSRQDYSIGIRKSEDVDESKFRDNKCDVVVLYKEDYDFQKKQSEDKQNQIFTLNERIKQLENEVNDIDETHSKNIANMTNEYYEKLDELKDKLSSKDVEFKEMELKFKDEIHDVREKSLKKINDLEKTHADEVLKLNKEISDLKQSHQADTFENESSIIADKQKTIDDLRSEISDMKVNHANEVNELEAKYKDTLVKLRTKDHNEALTYNKKLGRIREDFKELGFFEKHSKTYTNLLDDFDESLDEFEKTNQNKLLTIDEDFSKSLISEVNEDSERND